MGNTVAGQARTAEVGGYSLQLKKLLGEGACVRVCVVATPVVPLPADAPTARGADCVPPLRTRWLRPPGGFARVYRVAGPGGVEYVLKRMHVFKENAAVVACARYVACLVCRRTLSYCQALRGAHCATVLSCSPSCCVTLLLP
jgi:hypothetical protein